MPDATLHASAGKASVRASPDSEAFSEDLGSRGRSPSQNLPSVGFPTHEEIERLQLRKLQSLLGASRPANPFYARKLSACESALAPESIEAYKRLIPITTRHELV